MRVIAPGPIQGAGIATCDPIDGWCPWRRAPPIPFDRKGWPRGEDPAEAQIPTPEADLREGVARVDTGGRDKCLASGGCDVRLSTLTVGNATNGGAQRVIGHVNVTGLRGT